MVHLRHPPSNYWHNNCVTNNTSIEQSIHVSRYSLLATILTVHYSLNTNEQLGDHKLHDRTTCKLQLNYPMTILLSTKSA